MHTTHVSSGGRYPVLRTLAILYLVAALGVFVVGIWHAVSVLVQGGQVDDLFGAPTNLAGRAFVACSWLAATFIGVLAMLGIAELIKLLIDIEHNTRMARMPNTMSATAVAIDENTAVVVTPAVDIEGKGGRIGQWLEGEETAEAALLRGH